MGLTEGLILAALWEKRTIIIASQVFSGSRRGSGELNSPEGHEL